MTTLDEALCLAWRLSIGDWSDQVESELEAVLPVLIEAAYVEESGHSPTGSFWAFTEKAVQRLAALGCD